jgi:hypothetical protein
LKKNSYDPKLSWSLVQSIIPAIILLLFWLKYIFNGFDFTDEAYYLINITNPWAYDTIATQFGFIYYFLFKLAGENIAILRIFNFFLIFTVNMVLAYLFLDNFLKLEQGFTKKIRLYLTFSLAVASLIFYSLWLPTPNYNSLNYFGISLTAIGLLLRRKGKQLQKVSLAKTWYFWFLIGLGGYLVFMAKPQSAVGLAILALFCLSLSGNFSLKGLILSVIVSVLLLFISAQWLDGSVSSFIGRYFRAIEVEKITNAHTNLFFGSLDLNIVKVFFSYKDCIIFLLIAFWGILLAYLAELPNKNIWFLFIVFSFITFSLYFLLIFQPFQNSFAKGPWLWAPCLGVIAFEILRANKIHRFPGIRQLAWAIFFILLSFIYTFGSNNPSIIPLTLGSFYIFLGLLTLLKKGTQNLIYKLTGITLLSQLLIIIMICSAWNFPYRNLSPLWHANTPVSIPKGGHKLNLTYYQSQFINTLYEIADKANFIPNSPMIDLTGRLPGLLYLIGGNLPNVAWLGSDYSGSEKAAINVLKGLSCEELAKLWAIVAKEPLTFHFNAQILQEAGLEDFQSHYRAVGVFGYPEGIMGNTVIYQDLIVLKPKDQWPTQIEKCEAKRGINS